MNTLLVLLGPTGVGKTDLSIEIAEAINSPILSADSRQIYKGMEIGAASPSLDQLNQVKHYFIGHLNLEDYFSAFEYELQAISLLGELFKNYEVILVTGGSMLYLDALRYGIDVMPDVDPEIRETLQNRYKDQGLDPILKQLNELDPEHYGLVDKKNPKRVIHALEVCLTTNKTYSSFRQKDIKSRPFRILTMGLERDREDLFNRINQRVDKMMESGLLDEAKGLYNKRYLNSLNTVGYKEIFKFLDGEWSLDFAIAKIKQNTRIYSKQQMRWFKKDFNINWINLSHIDMSGKDIKDQIIKQLYM